ncbi:MAG: tryptophan synthase subunit alpha [Planctomycetes bacterium]|nr:tryptophan synthase subunit alpha [Planctomycetota bacterium]
MNFIDYFKKLKERREKALIPYFTALYPSKASFEKLAITAAESGADIIEIGLPFSDPLADGPVIQHSSQTALKNGFTIAKMFRSIAGLRVKTEIPFIIMTYLNPVLRYGANIFFTQCRKNGVNGMIIPDMIPEEDGPIRKEADKAGVAMIYLVAPTTPEKRMRLIASRTTGFIYAVSVTGVTGQRENIPAYLPAMVKKIRMVTDKPVCIGFGISTPEQAKAAVKYADGVIMGSAVVKITNPVVLKKFIKQVKSGIRITGSTQRYS